MGLPGVKVYTLNSQDTLETNSAGEVNIDIFPADEPIVFRFRFQKSRLQKTTTCGNEQCVILNGRKVYLHLSSDLTGKISQDWPFLEYWNLGTKILGAK